VYLTVQVAIEGLASGWLRHDLIGRSPSANVTAPLGVSGPAWLGVTSAV
jgi:hypothetical protein